MDKNPQSKFAQLCVILIANNYNCCKMDSMQSIKPTNINSIYLYINRFACRSVFIRKQTKFSVISVQLFNRIFTSETSQTTIIIVKNVFAYIWHIHMCVLCTCVHINKQHLSPIICEFACNRHLKI